MPVSVLDDEPKPESVGFEIAYSQKPIYCILKSPKASDDLEKVSKINESRGPLIFTHGAGGDLSSFAIQSFSDGYGSIYPILCFKGNMNLKSRTKMFRHIIEHPPPSPTTTKDHNMRQEFQGRGNPAEILGGRSMGCRAAVLSATPDTKFLILSSYPLQDLSPSSTSSPATLANVLSQPTDREKILLDLFPPIRILFIAGDRDKQCDLARLNLVRRAMFCKSWLCAVRGGDHGMDVHSFNTEAGEYGARLKSEDRDRVGRLTGRVAANWLRDVDRLEEEGKTEMDIYYGGEDDEPRLRGWMGQDQFNASVLRI